MTFKTITGSCDTTADGTIAFKSAEEAWFWFIQAQTAKNEGARITAGSGLIPRPCEPVDIITALERLYRNRMVGMNHVMVLRNYGRRMMAPDKRLRREAEAHSLWHEALDKLEAVLISKRIVTKPHWIKLVMDNDA